MVYFVKSLRKIEQDSIYLSLLVKVVTEAQLLLAGFHNCVFA